MSRAPARYANREKSAGPLNGSRHSQAARTSRAGKSDYHPGRQAVRRHRRNREDLGAARREVAATATACPSGGNADFNRKAPMVDENPKTDAPGSPRIDSREG
jgi:hypothetical protein